MIVLKMVWVEHAACMEAFRKKLREDACWKKFDIYLVCRGLNFALPDIDSHGRIV
jgi:hypothetical protein